MSPATRRILWSAAGLVAVLIVVGFAVVPGLVARGMNRTLDGAVGPIGDEALRIQGTLSVVDLHADALLWNRDLLKRGSWGHVDVPRLIEGSVAVQVFTVVTKTPRGMNIEANAGDSDNITLLSILERWPPRTWTSVAERAVYQAYKLQAYAANSHGRLAILRTRDDLAGYLAMHAQEPGTVAGLLGIEGAHALEGDVANLDRFFDAGFRLMGLTHFFDNQVGGSAHGVTKGGLTDFGRTVVGRMERLGMLVDLAHASPQLIDDVLAAATRPVVVSHTGVKGTCDNTRNLDDARLAAISATGGVIGIGLWETAVCGTKPADWARAVRHAVEVAGVEHVGLGSDWDGAVSTMIDASQTVHLTQALVDEGFGEEEIRMIMGGNALRVLAQVLPEAEPFGRRHSAD
ncbi:MAG: dipeptidase [Gemmatimonadota bacterium]|jgi:microsomal dipeptidase-like Zn-dependent dipeptidase